MKSRNQTKKRRIRNTKRRQKGGQSFHVHYGNTKVGRQLMTKDSTQQEPTIVFTPIPGKRYTIVMWDPDVPEAFQPGWAHWIITNLQSIKNIASNIVLAYHGPNPPSGTHRYFFGLFEQTTPIQVSITEREQFDIQEFVKQYQLKELQKVFMKVSHSSNLK